jgi:hypothetical protein
VVQASACKAVQLHGRLEILFEVRANLSSPQGARSVGRQTFENRKSQGFAKPEVYPGSPIFIRRDGPAGQRGYIQYSFVPAGLASLRKTGNSEGNSFRKKRFFFAYFALCSQESRSARIE